MNPTRTDLALVDAVERASVMGWPPTHVRELEDGWILRATPGLDRGRSCHALTPRTRALDPGELPLALERIRAFSAQHGIRGGLQVSPLEIHPDLVPALSARGWEPTWKVWVMVADRDAALATPEASSAGASAMTWSTQRTASADWLENWARCTPGADRANLDAHAQTVFVNLGTRGIFGALAAAASGIAVEDGAGEWAGLFSLVVAPQVRGLGLGRRLLRSLIAACSSERIYLQVNMDNAVALALYESFGFRRLHSYQHLLAPVGWAL